jgi:hypothetical protein
MDREKIARLQKEYPFVFNSTPKEETATYTMPKSDFITLFGHLSITKTVQFTNDQVSIKYTTNAAGKPRHLEVLK